MAGVQTDACECKERPGWARIVDDQPLQWPVLETGDWEELRECPGCARLWLCSWPEEREGLAILCRPQPETARRLRDIDHAATLRGYLLARIEEHIGELKETKLRCVKQGCKGRRLRGGNLCLEHLIAQRFGRQLSWLGRGHDDAPEDGAL